jgi:hypothetical protein
MVVQNAGMKRLVVVAAVLATCAGAGVQIAVDGDAGDVRQVAEVMPFPRSTSPLPVPEVTIQQGPWQDEVPFTSPTTVPSVPDGFVVRCTGNPPPCAVPDPADVPRDRLVR